MWYCLKCWLWGYKKEIKEGTFDCADCKEQS